MRLLEEKTKALVELKELEKALEVYQEMLALNPTDNQGIRCDLLRIFMTHGSLFDVEVDDFASIGGPYEAVTYAQQWCVLWYVSGLPFLLLSGTSSGNLKKIAKAPHIIEELIDVTDQLERFGLVGGLRWWEKFKEKHL